MPATAPVPMAMQSTKILDRKQDFPLLHESQLGRSLHYLDSAATTQKPMEVIDAVSDCYRNVYGPINRGLYPLAEAATAAYAEARAGVARFIGAPASEQLIFTRGTTDAINMVAWGWARPRLQPGDRVWITRMEHHANFLPWQRICRERSAELRIIDLNEDGSLNLNAATELFDTRTRLIALCQISNVLGTENPVAAICTRAAALGIPVLVDAAQSVAHKSVDVATIDCDFLAFSAHKMYGPSGIGALYGKAQRLEEMEPLLVGGGMVDHVAPDTATWTVCPDRFEAGSPNLSGAIGFAAAAGYLSRIGMDAIAAHETALTQQAVSQLARLPRVSLLPPGAATRASIISIDIEGIHPHDVAQLAGERGVALRAGHHCCQPLMQHLGLPATTRASFGIYNQPEDVDALISAVEAVCRMFA